MALEEVPQFVKDTQTFRLDYGEGNPNNARYHVRAIVDGRIVLRRWRKSKQRWEYEIEPPFWFTINAEFILP